MATTHSQDELQSAIRELLNIAVQEHVNAYEREAAISKVVDKITQVVRWHSRCSCSCVPLQ